MTRRPDGGKIEAAVARAVADILREGRIVAPIEVFIRMGRLARQDYEAWRFGRLPYLERVVQGNLSKAGRILRALDRRARSLGLRPSTTVYTSWGKRPRKRLRFSKSGQARIEAAYSRHFIASTAPDASFGKPPVRGPESE